jgi:iron complex outermembrane receptor protein
LALKYSWLNAEFDENDANKDGVISQDEKSINAPNHRGVALLLIQNLCKERLALSLEARVVQKYDF